MTIDSWLVVGLSFLGVAALVGFFRTKSVGFGRYTTDEMRASPVSRRVNGPKMYIVELRRSIIRGKGLSELKEEQ